MGGCSIALLHRILFLAGAWIQLPTLCGPDFTARLWRSELLNLAAILPRFNWHTINEIWWGHCPEPCSPSLKPEARGGEGRGEKRLELSRPRRQNMRLQAGTGERKLHKGEILRWPGLFIHPPRPSPSQASVSSFSPVRD